MQTTLMLKPMLRRAFPGCCNIYYFQQDEERATLLETLSDKVERHVEEPNFAIFFSQNIENYDSRALICRNT